MRAMWRAHGKPGGPQPGLVGKPYTLQDARARLAEVSGDRAFADEFFTSTSRGERFPTTRSCFSAPATVRKRNAGAGVARWVNRPDASGTINACAWGRRLRGRARPGGCDHRRRRQGEGSGVLQAAIKTRKPGDA